MEADLERIVGKEKLVEINGLAIKGRIDALQQIAKSTEKGPDLATLQKHIVNLTIEQRASANA
eukprot:gene8355-9211_t